MNEHLGFSAPNSRVEGGWLFCFDTETKEGTEN